MRKFITTLLLITTACSTTGGDYSNITVSDENMVSECKYLGDVSGIVGLYGVLAGPAYKKARALAIQQAAQMSRATNVVLSENSQSKNTIVTGRVYNCDSY